MIYSILLFTTSFALDTNVKLHVVKAQGAKLKAPDDDEYNFAEDDDDDPSNFSPDQFLDTDDGDAFLQTKFKEKIKSAARAKSIKEDENMHFFNTVKGEDEASVDDEDNPEYDDAFVQIALKSHVEFNKQMANKMKTAPNFLQKKLGAPDDDEYNFAEDDDDNPADFGVGQFLDNEDDEDDDDDSSFIQVYTPSEDNEYGDDRLGGEYVSAEEFEESDDQDENDDAAFFQEEALGHPRKHKNGKTHKDGKKHKDHGKNHHHKHHENKGHSKKVAATEIDSVVKQTHLKHDPEGEELPPVDGPHEHPEDVPHVDPMHDHSGDHPDDATHDTVDPTYEVATAEIDSDLKKAPEDKKRDEKKKGDKKGKKGDKKGKKDKKKTTKPSLLGVTDVYKQLEELKALEKAGKLRDDDQGWTAVDEEDQEDEEENRGSFLQFGDDENDDEYGDDRLDGGMEMMAGVRRSVE